MPYKIKSAMAGCKFCNLEIKLRQEINKKERSTKLQRKLKR